MRPICAGSTAAPIEPDASTVDDYAGDVIDLLDALHIEDAVIGGLSMGGYVAFALLRRAPSYVRGLILADTRSQADTPEGVENRKKMLQALADAGDRGPSVLIEEMLPKLLGACHAGHQPDVVARVRSLALSNPPEAIAGGIRALMTRPDSTPLLRTIHLSDVDRGRRRRRADAAVVLEGNAPGDCRLGAGDRARCRTSLEPRTARGVQFRARGVSDASGIVGGIMAVAIDRRRAGFCVGIVAVLATAGGAGGTAAAVALGPFEFVLDTYVRDGYVYYRALKSDRRRLDEYVNSLAAAGVDKRPKNAQIAFWLNAYNALVLRTVIDHYPAPRRSTEYPQGSIRQTPGAFERLTHRVAGRMLTLDQIEQTILAKYSDPRLHFAVGRGSVGGGRLRSEIFTAELLEKQLAEVASECVTRAECIQIDNATNIAERERNLLVERKGFVAAYADKADAALCHAQPGRARDPRLRSSEAAPDRTGFPGEEHLQARLPAVRLVPQRPHRTGRQINSEIWRSTIW